ncbi:MAG: D-alanine--D-alanine ligase [Nitrospirota bacterium]
MLTEKRIGILMGGISAERDVSLKSGSAVINALKGLGYDVIGIDIVPATNYEAGVVDTDLKTTSCAPSRISDTLLNEKVRIVFLALHGGYGENGAIQGLLDIMGIPYTGSGVLASALAMDKEASKKIFLYHNIPIPPFSVVCRESPGVNRESADAGFPMPWVIKPATEGSSIGVSIVKDRFSLTPALENAFEFSDRVILEKYIRGKEVHVGILRNTVIGSVEVRPKLEFYSYEAKYNKGLTDYVLPPDIAPELLKRAETVALSAHMALGCRGATRVDTIIDEHGESYLLEVNTIPGMTETSLLPKIAAHSGLDFPALIERMLIDAIKEKVPA